MGTKKVSSSPRAAKVHELLVQPTATLRRHPLPGTFLMSGLMGFVISIIYTASGRFETWFGDMGLSLGVSFMAVFMIMFIAALFSIMPDAHDLH